jgi:hypothetical protein
MGTTSLRPETLTMLAGYAVDGTLPDFVTRTYPLAEAVRGYQELAGSHTRGKLVVIVDQEAAR